jgi:C4-dicarboxylate-specific signal transduction histidine kinase
MTLNQSDWIALAAVLVSVLSAIYAKCSANEAKRANKISLHFKQVEIYEEVMTFSDCFRGIFSVPNVARLEQFRKQAVNRADIYFSDEVQRYLKEIHTHCSDSEVWLRISQDKDQVGVVVPHELEIRSEYKSVLNLLYPVLKIMRNELNINA